MYQKVKLHMVSGYVEDNNHKVMWSLYRKLTRLIHALLKEGSSRVLYGFIG